MTDPTPPAAPRPCGPHLWRYSSASGGDVCVYCGTEARPVSPEAAPPREHPTLPHLCGSCFYDKRDCVCVTGPNAEAWRRAEQRVEHLHTPLNGLLPEAAPPRATTQTYLSGIDGGRLFTQAEMDAVEARHAEAMERGARAMEAHVLRRRDAEQDAGYSATLLASVRRDVAGARARVAIAPEAEP